MQVVVDLPRLVADHEVVGLGLQQVVEHHEVGDEDLVHVPPGVEGVEVVLAGLGLEVRGLAGQRRLAGWSVSPRASSTRVTGILGQPVDLELRTGAAQRAGDRDVAQRVAEADGARDEQRAPAAARRPGASAGGGGRRARKSRTSRLKRTGSRAWGAWPEPSKATSVEPAMAAWACSAMVNGADASSVPWIEQGRRPDGGQQRRQRGCRTARLGDGGDEDLGRGLERPRRPRPPVASSSGAR